MRATAARAAARGIPTELLRVSSPRPFKALLELLVERDAGRVVLGPDLRRGSRWQLRLAANRLRRPRGLPDLDRPGRLTAPAVHR